MLTDEIKRHSCVFIYSRQPLDIIGVDRRPVSVDHQNAWFGRPERDSSPSHSRLWWGTYGRASEYIVSESE
jgi:hypothetical protein